MKAIPYVLVGGQVIATSKHPLEENPRQRPQKGIFETMLWENGEIFLLEPHFQRLRQGMALLNIPQDPRWEKEPILSKIQDLLSMGQDPDFARLRLHIFENLEDPSSYDYTLEAWEMDPSERGWNEHGYILGCRKATSLPPVDLGAFKFTPDPHWGPLADDVRQRAWDDVVRVIHPNWMTETSRANLFLLEGGKVLTPPLYHGCVHGLMRAMLLETLPSRGIPIQEAPLSLDRLASAQAVFLTNSVRRIQWVSQVEGHSFSPDPVKEIFDLLHSK